MKKILSLALAALMLVSVVPMVYAADVDYTQGTAVSYTGTGTEQYTVTVPAELAPGESGSVIVEGTWASNRVLTVTADATVTLTNSIDTQDTKTLDVIFQTFTIPGDNTTDIALGREVEVEAIENALFGTWSGKFNYNVEIKDDVPRGPIA
ncbi:MAG: hypothetical protein IJ298_08440 [Ruminococcus sp.]|nr:hypothetical protein [Ruminococcus sp.]